MSAGIILLVYKINVEYLDLYIERYRYINKQKSQVQYTRKCW